MPQWTVRLSEDLAEQISRAAEERGFSTPRAFIRDAVRKELQTQAKAVERVEDRIAASFDRLNVELRRVWTAQQAQFALTDALAKVFFVCVAEPPGDSIDQARTRAMARYEKFLKSVAASMNGGARASLNELLTRGE